MDREESEEQCGTSQQAECAASAEPEAPKPVGAEASIDLKVKFSSVLRTAV